MLALKIPNLCRTLTQIKYPIGLSFVCKRIQNENYRFLRICTQKTTSSLYFPPRVLNKAPVCYVHHNLDVKRRKHSSSKGEKTSGDVAESADESPEKLSLFQRYKKMLKEYWYVLIPVHMVTSAFWFGGFYYAAKSGIDIVPFLEYISLPEQFIKPLRNSSLGYIAVASAFYKLATPARYMVTLGGTSFAVKFLTKRGLIRPVPTKAELKTMLQNKLKKDSIDGK